MYFINKLKNKIYNQDFKQRINTSLLVIIELYRVMVSSLLILFISKNCTDHICSNNEKLVINNSIYTVGIIINFITLFSFIILYIIEIKRENQLITYLEVNIEKPCDNISVGNALTHLSNDKRKIIIFFDTIYQRVGQIVIIIFIINTILSGMIIYQYYFNYQIITTYITNILFMTTKMYDICTNVATETNIFYSAYLKSKIQYNDISDNNKIILNTKSNNISIDELQYKLNKDNLSKRHLSNIDDFINKTEFISYINEKPDDFINISTIYLQLDE